MSGEHHHHEETDPGEDAGVALLAGMMHTATACPAEVAVLASALVTVTQTPITGDVMPGPVLADRLLVLARLRTLLDGEVARVVAAAEIRDVLAHNPSTLLQREAAWNRSDAAAMVIAARFADRHPEVAAVWRSGNVATAVVATLARGLSGVAATVETRIVAAVTPHLGSLSVSGVKVLVARALDLLNPDDRDTAEQTDYDRRSVVFTTHAGMTMITADLPGLEGAAVIAALDAVAESLRSEADRLTKAQRRADALITLVNRAAAHGDLPTTAAGLPVAVTVTVGAHEADRVAAGQAREPVTDLAAAVQAGADPADIPQISGASLTLGQAATRFALCSGSHTGVIIDDTHRADIPITTALIATRSQPLAVGRARRFATPAQRVALAVRDRGCIVCQRPPAECQTHHLTDWADGGRTDLDALVLLCWAHHREVDLGRWVIERNPDPAGPHWKITPTSRHRWRRRTHQ
ncbi:MAG: DUF222 domain-containing protein [Candidatus Nanopelagicales bacterium]